MDDSAEEEARATVEEAFELRRYKSLGMAYRCRLCGGVFKTIYDAVMHLARYHRLTTARSVEYALRFKEALQEAVEEEEEEEEQGLLKWIKRK